MMMTFGGFRREEKRNKKKQESKILRLLENSTTREWKFTVRLTINQEQRLQNRQRAEKFNSRAMSSPLNRTIWTWSFSLV